MAKDPNYSSTPERSVEEDQGYLVPNWDQRGIMDEGYAIQQNYDDASKYVDNELQAFLQGNTRLSMSSIAPGGTYEFGSGTVSAPGIRWAADTDTGFYWISDGAFGVSINGVKVAEFNSSGALLSPMTPGSVLFAGTSGQITQDNTNFFFDDTTNALKLTGFMNVGTTTDAAAAGDFAAGATRKLFYDESLGFLQLTSTVAKQLRLAYTDASVYADLTVDSGGILNFTNTGASFLFDKASASAFQVIIRNSNAATSSAAISEMRVSGATGGNPFSRYHIVGVSQWSAGVDNAASDAYKIAPGGDFSTAAVLTISTAGVMTLAGNTLYSGDNTYDIGASVATRPRTGYFGTSLIIGATTHTITATGVVFNETGIDQDFRVESDIEAYCLMVEGTLNNVVMCANTEPAFNTMSGGLFLADANVAPTGNPSAGTYLYGVSGSLKARTTEGMICTLPSAVYKTADKSLTTATVENDNHLTVNLKASTKYTFRFVVFNTTASITAGFKCAISGTAGVTALKAQILIYDDTTNAIAALTRVTAFGTTVGAGLGAGDNYVIIDGSIDVSTAGTLVLQWAQNTLDAVNAVTVQIASSLVVDQVG